MIFTLFLIPALIAVACKDITWKNFGDTVVFVAIMTMGLTLLGFVISGQAGLNLLASLVVFLGLVYLTA